MVAAIPQPPIGNHQENPPRRVEVWKDCVPDGMVVTERLEDGSYLTTIRQAGTLDGWEQATTVGQALSGSRQKIAARDWVDRIVRKIAHRTHRWAVEMARGAYYYGTAD